MVFETLEDECFVTCSFFLNNFHKVLVDLIVIDGTKSSKFLGLSFCLDRWRNTSSWCDSEFLLSLRSTSPLRSLLSLRSSMICKINNSSIVFQIKTKFTKQKRLVDADHNLFSDSTSSVMLKVWMRN